MSAQNGNKKWSLKLLKLSHIVYKTEQDEEGRTYVTHVWYKLCAQHKHQIAGHLNLRGVIALTNDLRQVI